MRSHIGSRAKPWLTWAPPPHVSQGWIELLLKFKRIFCGFLFITRILWYFALSEVSKVIRQFTPGGLDAHTIDTLSIFTYLTAVFRIYQSRTYLVMFYCFMGTRKRLYHCYNYVIRLKSIWSTLKIKFIGQISAFFMHWILYFS